ncbi:MAG TPA: hypothetical protein VIF62_30570, partial [Labilithrix sp.]
RQTNSIHDQRVHGDEILERLRSERVPPALKPVLAAFADAQKKLAAATDGTETARAARDAALEAVGKADAALDVEVGKLADALVGAGLGSRKQPFAKFSPRPPSKLVALGYAREAREVVALCKAVRRGKPAGAVAKAVAACEKGAANVQRAIAALAKPQAAYARALAARDALLPAWSAALARLKRHAAVAWESDVATLKSIFAAPEAVAAPHASRKKTVAAPKPNGAPAPTPPA